MSTNDASSDELEPTFAVGLGFAIEGDDGSDSEMACRHVRGFREAVEAARDPEARVPAQLVLVMPNRAAALWLARWAEDTRCVRRSVTIRRVEDGEKVTAVASLASYGYGVETSILVESVASSWPGLHGIVRSGVHPKEAIDAVLGRPRP
jgi:hypothetical protein